jgi:hypothetical protein
MAEQSAIQPPAGDGISERPRTQRQPDYGNIVHVDCRKCGSSNLLDPARMQARKGGGVVLICTWCKQQFLVRRRDIGRPTPDASVASLYTTGSTEPPSLWKRLSRRS